MKQPDPASILLALLVLFWAATAAMFMLLFKT